MRNYCAKCGKRRESKFMKQSPITSDHYCFRAIRWDFGITCYAIHLAKSIELLGKQLKALKVSLQEDNLSSVKMSSRKDKNKQLTLLEMIEEITNQKS